MKLNLEVFAALQILKDNAENDFELHRIDVLENDLLNGPPKVEQIDDNHQKLFGWDFLKDSSNHYRLTLRIHQIIAQYCFGDIPQGLSIHHKDFNPENNSIENLQVLTNSEHRKIHSPKGKQVAKKKLKTFVCENCGKTFQTYDKGDNRFCSRKCCDSKKYREYMIVKTCAYCGKEFVTNKHNNPKCCSHSCAGKLRFKSHHQIKICPVCGKEFETLDKRKVYCSRKCGNKIRTIRGRETVTCLNCGKVFSPILSRKQKFCSRSCSAEFHRSKGTKKPTRPEDSLLNSADN